MRTIVMNKKNIEGSTQSIESRTKVIKKALETAKQLKSRNMDHDELIEDLSHSGVTRNVFTIKNHSV